MELKTNVDPSEKSTKRPVLLFVTSFFVSFLLTYFLKDPAFTDSQVYVMFLLFFALLLWITEAIPAFSVGLFIIAYLVFALGNPNFNSAPENIEKYANTFSSSNIWLMLGGFFLASAMAKTKLDVSLFRFTLQTSGSNPRNLVIGLMTTTMIASMVMSNTAATAMVIASVMPLLKNIGKDSGLGKAVLLGVPVAATTGGMATIIGTPPNIIAAAALENAGIKMNFLDWMIYGAPLAIGLTAISCIVLLLYYVKDATPINTEFLKTEKVEMSKEFLLQRRVVIIVLIITLAMWLTGEWHGITVSGVTAIPIVILPLAGIITGKDVRALPWDTLFLIAGALSLGVALKQTGLLSFYTEQLKGMQFSVFMFLLIFGYITMAVSNVMSHTAATSILIPLGMAILPDSKLEVALVIGLASSTAMLLPVSTPPNAIAYSTGLMEQKDFRVTGLVSGLIGPALAVLWILLVS